jgi:7-carboxy-7-deazaguanine synthase
MFGTNELIGKKYFKDAPANSLMVTSMFFTLQGEGPYAGQPALFVRLAKCNLTCSFCDTFFDDGEWMTFDEIFKRADQTITSYWTDRGLKVPHWVKNFDYPPFMYPGVVLVLTGGEPLLQENTSQFLEKSNQLFAQTQVESNGIPDTVVPDCTVLVCSPKCAEKDGKPTKYLKPSKTILERADCLKFVMSADPESPYHTIPDWAFEWGETKGQIYCSPMNVYNDFPQKIKLLRAEKGAITMAERSTVDEVISFWEPGLLNLEKNQANHEYTAKFCMDHGFKLNLQMHLYASLA